MFLINSIFGGPFNDKLIVGNSFLYIAGKNKGVFYKKGSVGEAKRNEDFMLRSIMEFLCKNSPSVILRGCFLTNC
jgi:hypothetical protein